MSTIAECIAEALWQAGIKHIVGLPGNYVIPLYEAVRARGFNCILVDDEINAPMIADGYFKLSREPVAIFTTAGPAAARVAAGLQAPFSERSPVLVFTGMPPLKNLGKGCLQEGSGINSFDQIKFLSVVCKYCKRVDTPAEVAPALSEALTQLKTFPYAPVNLSIPVDTLTSEAHAFEVNILPRSFQPETNSVSAEQWTLILDKLQTARQPLILAGGGVYDTESYELLSQLVAKTGIPVATTLRGKGVLDESHSLALGCVGYWGQAAANHYWRESNVVLVLGATFSETTTHCFDDTLTSTGKYIIQLDLNPSAFKRSVNADLKLQVDIPSFLKEFLAKPFDTRSELTIKVDKLKTRMKHFARNEKESTPLHPEQALDVIRDYIDSNTIVVSECITWTEGFLPVAPRVHLVAGNAATLGYGVACVGVKMARPEKKVICILGDGGFRYQSAAIEICVRHKLPITWVVFNNASHLNVAYAQEKMYGVTVNTRMADIDFATVGRGYGAEGYIARTRSELSEALRAVLSQEVTSVIDVKINDSHPVPPSTITRLIVGAWGFKPRKDVAALLKLGQLLKR